MDRRKSYILDVTFYTQQSVQCENQRKCEARSARSVNTDAIPHAIPQINMCTPRIIRHDEFWDLLGSRIIE